MVYYNALMAKETELQASLARVQSSVAMLNITLAQLQNSTSIQVIALSDVMADERNILSDMQQNHILPLALKPVNCVNISQDNLTAILVSIQQIQGDLTAINSSIQQL
jgi:hypothetical protein